ncbi:MAG TPA: outer membrane beta-barrel family protein [Chitinophagaceae bacterium]|nr:outer membrane beta-barrel family protein [Chitinophagaceae bacterium]
MRKLVPVLAILLITFSVNAQNPYQGGNRGGGRQINGRFYGKIVDSVSNKPIEFASVQLLQNRFDSVSRKRKEVVVAGMLTKANGEFSLENVPAFGQYKLKISVIGFKPYEQPVSFDLKMARGNSDPSAMLSAFDKDLGNIKLNLEEKVLSNVTVTSSKPLVQLGIDRKIFNVEKNIVSAGGTAVDVMRNVPSLNVDIDGNVTLRNNTPQLFVDGRPTIMTLDQIPADAIESVEIITNPSAKFDASGGTAGILNIVLKKNRKVGYNGNVRASVDSRGKVGGGADINVRQNKINVFASGNYFQRKSISNGTTNQLSKFTNPNTLLNQLDKSTMNGSFGFGRAGIDYFIDNRNTLSITGNIGKGTFDPNTTSDLFIDTLGNPVTSSFSQRLSNSSREFKNMGSQLSYKHNFPKAGQELTADVTYNAGKNNSSNPILTNYYDQQGGSLKNSFSQNQLGSGTNKNLIIQSDYSNPLSDKAKLEMGVRAAIRSVDSKNDFYIYDPNSGDYVYNAILSSQYNSKDQVYAAYTTFTNQLKNFGYQVGLRVESSNYHGELPDKGQSFKINFPVSLFPSFFLSQKFKNDQQLQLNYTRRINRPNFWQLFPFTDYSDSLNISRGNPNLKPEFTNSFELSYEKTFQNRDNFIASIYYKNTNDLITRYQVADTNQFTGKPVLINTYINANSSYVTGLELISKNAITKWWDITSNFNLYTSKIKIDDPNQPNQDQFVSWFGKLSNNFKLPKNFSIQVSGNYQSKTILPPGGSASNAFGGGRGGFFGQPSASQGYVRANWGVDAAVRFDFLKNKTASLSLNVNDIFRTRLQDIHSESFYFIQDASRRRDPQVFRLNFNLRFGKFDASLFKRKNTRSDNLQNMDNGGMNF